MSVKKHFCYSTVSKCLCRARSTTTTHLNSTDKLKVNSESTFHLPSICHVCTGAFTQKVILTTHSLESVVGSPLTQTMTFLKSYHVVLVV